MAGAVQEIEMTPSIGDFQANFPKDVKAEIPKIGVGSPPIAPPFGTGTFDAGVGISFTCPGFPDCKRAAGACVFKKKQGVSLDPTKLIPGLPSIPSFNFVIYSGSKIKVSVPPDIYNPLKCPNYPKKASTTT